MPTGQYKRTQFHYNASIEAMRKVNLGKKRPPEVIAKVTKANLGKKRTPEQILRNRLARIGKGLGLRNGMWRGGVTSLQEKIRKSYQYRQWRSDCFTRDNYTCQICGKRGGGRLEVDHFPKTFSLIIQDNNIKTLEESYLCEELWNINNGRTLCITCHKKTDTWGKKASKLLKSLGTTSEGNFAGVVAVK